VVKLPLLGVDTLANTVPSVPSCSLPRCWRYSARVGHGERIRQVRRAFDGGLTGSCSGERRRGAGLIHGEGLTGDGHRPAPRAIARIRGDGVETEPLPDPLLPESIMMNESLLTAVQAQSEKLR